MPSLDLETKSICSSRDGRLQLLLLKVLENTRGNRTLTTFAGVWKPDVQLVGAPATGPAPQGQTYTQTSLVANPVPEDSHWDVKHNITAKVGLM